MSGMNPRSGRVALLTWRFVGRDGISRSRGPDKIVPITQREMAGARLDDRIDHALELTFPASDPPAWQRGD
jgi:hypothetical protein